MQYNENWFQRLQRITGHEWATEQDVDAVYCNHQCMIYRDAIRLDDESLLILVNTLHKQRRLDTAYSA